MLVKLDWEPYCEGSKAYSVCGWHFTDTDLTYRYKVICLLCRDLIMNENLSDVVPVRTNTVVTLNKKFHFFFIFGGIAPLPPHPEWLRASSFTRFLYHTQWRATVGRTALDEWSSRRRDLYLTTHNTQKRQTLIPQAGFEPTISASERPQTYALDRAVTGADNFTVPVYCILRKIRVKNMGRGSSVIIVIRLQNGHHRNRNSIAGRGKGLFSSPSSPDRFWFPRSLLSNVYRGRFSRSKSAAAWSWPITSTCYWG